MLALFALNKNDKSSTHIETIKELISRLLVLHEQFKVLENLNKKTKKAEQNVRIEIQTL